MSQICRLLFHVNLRVNFKHKITREICFYCMDRILSGLPCVNIKQMNGKQISFPFSPPKRLCQVNIDTSHPSISDINQKFFKINLLGPFHFHFSGLIIQCCCFFLKKGNKCNSWNVNIAADLIFFFSFFIFWLISWFTITVLISAVACLLCFKEHWVERESVFTLSNRRSQKAPCPSHTVHSVFLELELLTVWCIWRPLNSFVDIPSLLKKKPSVKNLSVLNE